MSKKNIDQNKKNNIFKNIGIVMGAWLRRYPSAWILLPLYLGFRIAAPFFETLASSKVVSTITQGDVKNFLITIACLLFLISITSAAINIIGSFLQGQRIYTRLNDFAGGIFRKSLRTDYQNVELQKNQKILGKAANAVSGNMYGPEELMLQTINILVVLLGIGSYGTIILMLDWRILLVILAMFAGNLSLQSYAIKYNDKHRAESSEIWRKKNYIKQKSMNISAGKDIRIYQMKEWFHTLLNDVIKNRRAYDKKVELIWYFPTISDVFFNFLRDFLAYSILIHRVLNGEIDAATFTLYIGLIGSFSAWIYGLSGNFSNLKRASHEFNDWFEFMNLKDSIDVENSTNSENSVNKFCNTKLAAKADPTKAENGTNAFAIEFKNVGFTYDGAEKSTLSGLNFSIKAGEKIALVGNNGAGKTTIVKLLTGLYPQTEGDILINGKSIKEIGLSEYQDSISVLFQDTVPMAFSIAENVSGVDYSKTDLIKVQDALTKAGLAEKVASLKNKDKTYITQNLDDEGILLSGGETQKLLLAKAIYKNGSFLILDEPTSALDPIAESKIYEEYNQMAQGKTAVFISHRLASTKFCDRIMFLDNGKIAEFGTHEELMALGGKYKEMFSIQSQYYN